MVGTRRSARVQASDRAEDPPQAAAANGGGDPPAPAPTPAGQILPLDQPAGDAPAVVVAAEPAAAPDALGSPPSAKRRRQEPSDQLAAQKLQSSPAAPKPSPGSAANGPAPASNGSGEGADVLDGFRRLPQLRAALETLQARVDDSAVFLRPSAEVAAAAREVAKLLYQQYARVLLEGGGPGAGTRAERRALRSSSLAPLPELHTDASFDPEQIWLQLEPATEAAVRRVRRLARIAEPLAGGAADLLTAEAAAGIDRLLSGGRSSDEDDEEEEGEEEGLGDSEMEEGEQEEEDGEEEDGEEEDGEEEDDEEEGRKRAKKARTEPRGGRKPGGRSAPPGDGRLEDRFFRLSDLERYVEDAERRAMAGSEEGDEDDGLMGRAGEGAEGEEEDDEGDAGLFEGLDDSDDEEAAMERLLSNTAAAAGKKKGKDASGIRYQDFFGGGGADEDDEEGDEDESDDDDDDDDGKDGEGAGKRGGRRGGLLYGGDDSDVDEDGEEDDMEGDEEDGGAAARRRSGKDAGPRDGDPGGPAERQPATKRRQQQQQQQAAMSAHEKRLARLQERVAELEAEALADKAWFLTGEAAAGSRPINSALELDMDFETTAKPAPVQTEEMTTDLEVMIRKRIADRRFDDVVRVVPQPLETKKKAIELDDTKAKSGLGELYEQDFVRQVAGGTAEDKDEKLRQEARSLFKALCGKLDALCRFHFAPKPVVEDMTVRSEVPAIAMEEAAPVAVSKAAMQLPSEVYQPGAKDGRPLAEGELTKEERKQRRARKKRQRKAREASKEEERRAKAVAEGGTAAVVGRKSDSKVVAGKGVKLAEGAGAGRHGRTDLGNSSAVFAKLAAEQQAAAAAAAGGGVGKVARELKKKATGGGQEAGKKGAVLFKL